MLHKNQRQPPLSRNAAPHSGAVAWVRSLKERATGQLCHRILPAALRTFCRDRHCQGCTCLLHTAVMCAAAAQGAMLGYAVPGLLACHVRLRAAIGFQVSCAGCGCCRRHLSCLCQSLGQSSASERDPCLHESGLFLQLFPACTLCNVGKG